MALFKFRDEFNFQAQIGWNCFGRFERRLFKKSPVYSFNDVGTLKHEMMVWTKIIFDWFTSGGA